MVFDDMFVLNRDIHDHLTRQYDSYHSFFWKLKSRQKSIRIQGPAIWNQLAIHCDDNCSLVTFKYHVKKYLLENDITL